MAFRSALLALLLCSSANAGAIIPAAFQKPPANSAATAEDSAAGIARGAPGWAVPSGRTPFVLRFRPGGADIDAAMARTLDAAAAAYRSSGFAWVRFVDPTDVFARRRPQLSWRRASKVRAYFDSRGIWSVPLRQRDGRWIATRWSDSEGGPVAGLALMGVAQAARLEGDDDDRPDESQIRPIPPSPTPPPPVPPLKSRPGTRPQVRPDLVPDFATRVGARASPTDAMRTAAGWLTPTGTLNLTALQTLIDHCVQLEGELTAECQSAVDAGEGPFAAVPRDARDEFSLLLTGCRTLREGRTCAESVSMERQFRALPRGRLDPHPLTMQEGVRTTFIARIIYEGDRAGGGRPGVPIGDTRPPGKGGSSQSTVVPFSGRMCFSLTADPADFLIRPIGEPCPQISEGSSRVKYDPQWEVTPLRSGKLELKLKTELFVGKEKKEFRHEPYPLIIDVAPKPSLWDRIDATLARATGTVDLATKLAAALGALFTAVAGWGIWAWLRKRRRKRRSKAAET